MPIEQVQDIYNNILQDPLFVELAIDEIELKSEIVRNSNRLNPNCYNYLTLIELLTKHNLANKAFLEALQNDLEPSPLLDNVMTKDKLNKYIVGDIEAWFYEDSIETSKNPNHYLTRYGNEFSQELKKCSRAIVGVVQISPLC